MSRRQANRQRQGRRKAIRNGCAGKKRYQTPELAMPAAESLFARKKGLTRIGIYLCPLGACHYHLTTKPQPNMVGRLLELTTEPINEES